MSKKNKCTCLFSSKSTKCLLLLLKYRAMVIWHVVLGIVANVFTLYLPRLISHVIDAYLQGTIENADGIFFVGGGEVALAGFMENAVSMLLHGESKS